MYFGIKKSSIEWFFFCWEFSFLQFQIYVTFLQDENLNKLSKIQRDDWNLRQPNFPWFADSTFARELREIPWNLIKHFEFRSILMHDQLESWKWEYFKCLNDEIFHFVRSRSHPHSFTEKMSRDEKKKERKSFKLFTSQTHSLNKSHKSIKKYKKKTNVFIARKKIYEDEEFFN